MSTRRESEPTTPTPFDKLARGLLAVPRKEYEAERAKYERKKAERKKRGLTGSERPQSV